MSKNDWLQTELAQNIWEKKYQYNGETFDEWLDRVSNNNENLKKLIADKKFLFAGRILSNRGTYKDGVKCTYSNCYVLDPPEDNLESIYETAKKLARTFSYGGGVGIDLGKLRPRNAKVNNSAKKTTGAVSFMPTFSEVTGTIGQNNRRGALMISMPISHPDIEEFIDIKTDLTQVTKANISVRITNEFLEAVENNSDYTMTFTVEDTEEVINKTVNAKELFMKLCKNNWDYAEPGILYWDNIENWNIISEYDNFSYSGVNPCLVGSTKIQTVEGEIPIEKLVGTKPYVYCCDEQGNLTIRQATKVWKTRKNAELVKVNHLRGSLICTPDHLILTRNRGWVKARELEPKDKLVGLNRCMKDEKHCAVALTGSKKYVPEHRFILNHFENIDGFDVHHKNNNPLDNRLSNLEKIKHHKHSIITNTGRQIDSERDELGRFITKEVKKSRDTLSINKHHTGKNWIVTSVETLSYKEDVYDMTVKEVHNFVADGIIVHNCAEEPLPSGGSCLLGSLNLSEFVENPFTDKATFNFNEFGHAVYLAVKGLNEVLDEGLPLHPLYIQRDTVRAWRQIGLGIMGLADCLIKLGVAYGSEESFKICDKIGECLKNQALLTSTFEAKEKGTFPMFDKEATLKSPYVKATQDHVYKRINKYGLRNSQILTIAPTGTLSTMLGISGGVEPIFNLAYTRKTESLGDGDRYYTVFTPVVKEYLDAKGITVPEDISVEELTKLLPDYFVTAMNLDPIRRVKMQGTWQKYIDASISSTVNLPNEATVEDVYIIYMTAYKEGLKGITVFRDGCKRTAILTNTTPKKEESKEDGLPRGFKKQIAEDTVYYKKPVHIGCGKLNLFIGYSPSEKCVQDLYIKKSGNGGCEKNLETTVIGMSLVLRLGGTLEMIEKSFSGISTCSSFTRVRSKGETVSKGAYCGGAIINILKDFLKEVEGTVVAPQPKVEKKPIKATNIIVEKPKCPECGAEVQMTEGCMTCSQCGYSKCS